MLHNLLFFFIEKFCLPFGSKSIKLFQKTFFKPNVNIWKVVFFHNEKVEHLVWNSSNHISRKFLVNNFFLLCFEKQSELFSFLDVSLLHGNGGACACSAEFCGLLERSGEKQKQHFCIFECRATQHNYILNSLLRYS